MAADDDDKTEEPTQARLDEARRKGDIVYTPEVGSALSLLAATLLCAFLAAPMMHGIADLSATFLASPHALGADPAALRRLAMNIVFGIAGAIGLASMSFFIAGLASRYLQDAPTFTGERLSPDLSKLNPIEGAKRVFGKAAFAQFAKSLAKFAVVGAALAMALWPHDDSIARMALLDPAAILAFLQDRALSMLIALTSAAAALAAVDYIFTRQSYRDKLKMSRREIRDEMRQSDGDPMVKAKLRQIRTERAKGRMMANVPKATVVITNPTHYAVALRYVQGETAAPICLAKGVDEVAARIREVAQENNVPLVEDPPLARALYASADIDEAIPREHFEAVAKVIGVVMRLARRRRGMPGDPNRRL